MGGCHRVLWLGSHLLSWAGTTNPQFDLHFSLPLALLPCTLPSDEGPALISLWLAREIRTHQNCPLKINGLYHLHWIWLCQSWWWSQRQVQGSEASGKSQLSPQYFHSGENMDVSLLIRFPDQFLKLIVLCLKQDSYIWDTSLHLIF